MRSPPTARTGLRHPQGRVVIEAYAAAARALSGAIRMLRRATAGAARRPSPCTRTGRSSRTVSIHRLRRTGHAAHAVDRQARSRGRRVEEGLSRRGDLPATSRATAAPAGPTSSSPTTPADAAASRWRRRPTAARRDVAPCIRAEPARPRSRCSAHRRRRSRCAPASIAGRWTPVRTTAWPHAPALQVATMPSGSANCRHAGPCATDARHADGSPRAKRGPCRTTAPNTPTLISAGAAGHRLAQHDGRATRLQAWVSRDDGRSFVLQELDSSSDDNDHPRLVRHGEAPVRAVAHHTKGIHVHAFPKLAAGSGTVGAGRRLAGRGGPARHRAVRRRHWRYCRRVADEAGARGVLVHQLRQLPGGDAAAGAELRRRRIDATLVAGHRHGAGEDDVHLLRRAHYRVAERLFAFDGQPRRCAMPSTGWRGAAPYVGLLVPGQSVRWATVAPSSAELDARARPDAGFPVPFQPLEKPR